MAPRQLRTRPRSLERPEAGGLAPGVRQVLFGPVGAAAVDDELVGAPDFVGNGRVKELMTGLAQDLGFGHAQLLGQLRADVGVTARQILDEMMGCRLKQQVGMQFGHRFGASYDGRLNHVGLFSV